MLGQNTRPLWPGKSRRCMAQLGMCSHRTPRNMSSLGFGSAVDKEPTWDCAPTENWGVWTAWAWKEQEIHGSAGTGPSRTPGNLSSLELGSAGDTQPTWDCTPSTGRTLGSLGLGSAWDTWPSYDSALAGHPGAWVVGSEKCTSPWSLADPLLSIYYKGSPQIPAVFVCSVPASPQHNRTNDPEKGLLLPLSIRA